MFLGDAPTTIADPAPGQHLSMDQLFASRCLALPWEKPRGRIISRSLGRGSQLLDVEAKCRCVEYPYRVYCIQNSMSSKVHGFPRNYSAVADKITPMRGDAAATQRGFWGYPGYALCIRLCPG